MSKEKSKNKKQKTNHLNAPTIPSSSSNGDKAAPGLDGSVENIFGSLIAPHSVSDFFAQYWEQKPLVIQGGDERCGGIFKDVFNRKVLAQLVSKEKLVYIKDIHACKCVNGKTEDLNKNGRVLSKDIERLMKTGATLQVHQPQRFIDPLWNMLEKLECYFGCLVGSNVYMTPKGTQGLAPHYDDVEVFIVQLEGEKHWRLYKAPVEHANEYKTNLPSDSIGDPTHDFTLKPGDVLYMPRGTVHQAIAVPEISAHSTHITISTYQKHSGSEYLLSIFPHLIEKATKKSAALRKGLPLNFFSNSGKNLVPALLKNLTEAMESETEVPCSRIMMEDFMTNRLPPFGFDSSVLEETPDGNAPTISSSIKITRPQHTAFCLTQVYPGMFDEDDEYQGDDDEEQEADSQSLLVYTTLYNDRCDHMVQEKGSSIEPSAGILKFPCAFHECMEQLKSEADLDHWTAVKNLRLKSDSERIQFATALWTQHIVTSQN